MRSIVVRLLLLIPLGWLMWLMFEHTKATQTGANPDGTGLVIGYLVIMGLGVIMAGILSMLVIPAIGDAVGSLIYNSPEQAPKNPHAPALAKINAGDLEGAVEEYKAVLEQTPDDTLAISEVVHLYCDKLGQPDEAATFLEAQIENGDWTNDQVAFLSTRLVDVYWLHQQDAFRSREILLQIAEQFPDTRHSANAFHRLQEIDRTLV